MKCHFCDADATTVFSIEKDYDFGLCDVHLRRFRLFFGPSVYMGPYDVFLPVYMGPYDVFLPQDMILPIQ